MQRQWLRSCVEVKVTTETVLLTPRCSPERKNRRDALDPKPPFPESPRNPLSSNPASRLRRSFCTHLRGSAVRLVTSLNSSAGKLEFRLSILAEERSDMVAVKYGTEDLTGVPKHIPEWFASPPLRMPQFISVAKLTENTLESGSDSQQGLRWELPRP
ncbi:hypothetical protein llap_10360 [Limosa lapponica baueri]|uniref:Uncharacterized protein n=1 Tax=Limosa lapponica baueri TaxID=1758121 RepID=A0A2I0TZT6_LIMLA|nr:hypothetical protein llap_10360 [Limosa lapponica baueri]